MVQANMRYLQRVFNKIIQNPYVLIAPAVILVCLFSIYPLLFAIKVSFLNWDVVTNTQSFVGFNNYVNIFNDPVFGKVLKIRLYIPSSRLCSA